MAKTKNKKKISADQFRTKKETKKALNPFEIHVNKEKIRVLGKKGKNDRGLPGVSRTKAIQKRKHTLLREYKIQNKTNKFVDRRIGERDYNMTEEEKYMARFTAERVKAHSKKSIFNLADDEVLTHKGQTISEIEKFDDPRSEDEESLDENTSGKLDKQFVKDAHFGGGVLTKTGKDGAKTHRELIDELIAESKKRKAEKQKTKEATLELTEKLDTEWKDLLPIVNKSKKTEKDKDDKPKIDDYDKVMRELRFEARGTVSDRLKTEDEIAKEEKEKLEELEKERLERMKGHIEENKPKPHRRTADDLEDDFILDDEDDPNYMLSYNTEGESNVQIDAELNGKRVGKDDSGDENIEEESEEAETASEDDLSDLKEDESESESEEEETKIKNDDAKNVSAAKSKNADKKTTKIETKECEDEVNLGDKSKENIVEDLLKRKEIMDKARKELPYTFSLPNSYESLLDLLESQPSTHQSVIIERMIKCNHPSLAEGNKDHLGLLFAYLLQYLNDLFSDISDANTFKKNFEIFKALVPQIYNLAEFHPLNAHNSVLEVIKEKQSEYRKKCKEYPSLEVLVFFKIVSILFPTSDFRHQVVTSCFVFIEQMLTKCKVRNKKNISYGFFLSTIVLEYTSLSKRFLPAVINFLSGVLHMAVPKGGVRLIKVLPPFKSTNSLLVLVENCSLDVCTSLKMNFDDLIDGEIDDSYKIRTLLNTVKVLKEFYIHFEEIPSLVEIFEPVLKYLELIPTNNYPNDIKVIVEDFVTIMKNDKETRKIAYLFMEAQKPKALRLYEPKIEEVYDGKRFKKQSKEKAERDKLLHKFKKEKKSALREIRRDNAFLGRVKINEKLRSDKERIEKVKRIFADASIQQSELNELDRKKKRKK